MTSLSAKGLPLDLSNVFSAQVLACISTAYNGILVLQIGQLTNPSSETPPGSEWLLQVALLLSSSSIVIT